MFAATLCVFLFWLIQWVGFYISFDLSYFNPIKYLKQILMELENGKTEYTKIILRSSHFFIWSLYLSSVSWALGSFLLNSGNSGQAEVFFGFLFLPPLWPVTYLFFAFQLHISILVFISPVFLAEGIARSIGYLGWISPTNGYTILTINNVPENPTILYCQSDNYYAMEECGILSLNGESEKNHHSLEDNGNIFIIGDFQQNLGDGSFYHKWYRHKQLYIKKES
jgi:hypothetical protein